MDSTDLHTRLMDDARRYDPTHYNRSRLVPFRDVLLVWRAKRMSYERIAAALTKHGFMVSPSSVGAFCRRTLIETEILRERHRLETGNPVRPAATAPSSSGFSAVATPKSAAMPPGRRGPNIARDNY